jgi:DNA-binding LacI/PurR family transcriptional regulator
MKPASGSEVMMMPRRAAGTRPDTMQAGTACDGQKPANSRSNRVTANEVAKRAGVSQPTVSRVFTPGTKVSEDLRRNVLRAADELGYLPNTLARSLQTGRSYTIGIVVAYLNNPFYPEALQKFSKDLNARGYHLMVFFADNSLEEIDGVVEDLMAHQVDAIILAAVSLSNDLSTRLNDLGIPFVLFNRGQEDESLPSVTATNFKGGYLAGQHLVAAGHKRIAHISGWQKALNGRQRQEGFVKALADAGTTPLACIDCHFRREMAIEATRELFRRADKPDAIFVGSDFMAFGVVETLQDELGLKIPDDVSVIGYDDVEMAAWKMFDLTTIRQPINRMVRSTVDLLLDLIEGATDRSIRLEIDSELVVRGSTRAVAGNVVSSPDMKPDIVADINTGTHRKQSVGE